MQSVIDRLVNKKSEHKNRNWKKRYKQILKYDHDFDSVFLIRLIIYKLELMRKEFLENDYIQEESINRMVSEIDEVLYLGYAILEEDCYQDTYNFMNEHFSVRKITTEFQGKEVPAYKGVWDSEDNKLLYNKYIDESYQKQKETEKKFFTLIAENYNNWGI